MLESDFSAGNHTNQNPSIKQNRKPQRKATWNPPPMGWTKLNVDASFVRSFGVGYTTLVCRDSNGHLLAISSNTRKISSPLAAEALALREA
ncbi:hypothetical protein PIB30_030580, partial [Stylosanthes scabra]|nr:hypothetical protein [Stylosanthes scabra]